MKVKVLNYGKALQSYKLPDRNNNFLLAEKPLLLLPAPLIQDYKSPFWVHWGVSGLRPLCIHSATSINVSSKDTHAQTHASSDPSRKHSNPKRFMNRNCLWIFRFMNLQGAPFEIKLIKQVILLISCNYLCKSQGLRPVVTWNLIWSQVQPGSVSPVGICKTMPLLIFLSLSRYRNLLATAMWIDKSSWAMMLLPLTVGKRE